MSPKLSFQNFFIGWTRAVQKEMGGESGQVAYDFSDFENSREYSQHQKKHPSMCSLRPGT